MDSMEALGCRMQIHGYALLGVMSNDQWIEFLKAVASRMDMSPCGEPIIRTYPVDGKGGVGSTIFQAITESFIAIDTWPEQLGAYLIVCSCKPFITGALQSVMISHGLTLNQEAGHTLGIGPRRF